MNKIKFLLISISILVISAIQAQESPKTPTSENSINITKIQMEKSRSKGLTGLKITLDLEEQLSIEHNLNIHYSLDGEPYVREYREMRPVKLIKASIFHPFAILYQEPGEYYSTFRLDSIYEPDKKIKFDIVGVRDQAITIEVPTMHTIELKVNYTEVTETNHKGKAWDYNFFKTNKTDTYPDLFYTIESTFNEDSRGVFGGQFYKTHKQKNTVIASWPYYSELIYYCEGDVLSICVKDADTIFHDSIGCIALSKLISMENKEELNFGSVVKFSCELLTD